MTDNPIAKALGGAHLQQQVIPARTWRNPHQRET